MRVQIYTKPACSLCEEARAVLERLQTRLPFTLLEEDIRADPELFARYRYDIPLVLVNGAPAFKLRLDESEVETYLRQALECPPPGGQGGET